MALLEKKTLELGASETGNSILMDVDPTSEYVQIRIGEERGRVKKTELYSAIFAIADEKVQSDLIPVRTTEVMHYDKIHTVQLKKDLRKGQIMKVKCHISVPTTVVEGLKGLMKKETGSSLALL